MTISGTNFGTDSEAITPSLGTLTCLKVAVTEPHARIECEVPLSDEFCKETDCQNMKTTMDVAGLKSEPSQNFTYALPGCMDTDARNFNDLATEDDGSCIVVGCTDSLAQTYVAKANENNQTMCIYPPQEVEMKIDMDFEEYQKDKVRVEETFVSDVSRELGVEKVRVVITGAKKGSVIFSFIILDDPNNRADKVLERMEEKLMTNNFSISYTCLLYTSPSPRD